MQKVMDFQPTRKAPKSFFAHLFDVSGVLAKVDGALVFFGDDDTITTVEPQDCNFLTVLGEVGVSETQGVMDRLHGSAPWIATHRLQEVA
jgi:hypothetical protein